MEFQDLIQDILKENFKSSWTLIKKESYLIRYLIIKTKAANRDSKSRGSFANLYALLVLIEDFVNKGYDKRIKDYDNYEGAMFSELLSRMRKLPFGEKLQNHSLNNRLNDEFRGFFPDIEEIPIIRNLKTKKYKINTDLLVVKEGEKKHVLAQAIIDIILNYTAVRQENFKSFTDYCDDLAKKYQNSKDEKEIKAFIAKQLKPNVDARIFEIVSYSILKVKYAEECIYWGFTKATIQKENLLLYKTGRTNANDGGIDFVMKPLGRFFQVTETLDFKKYFLDLDKIQKFPMVFVIKTLLSEVEIKTKIASDAKKIYKYDNVIQDYLGCFEEIINIQKLLDILDDISVSKKLDLVLEEIKLQTKVEFNLMTIE